MRKRAPTLRDRDRPRAACSAAPPRPRRPQRRTAQETRAQRAIRQVDGNGRRRPSLRRAQAATSADFVPCRHRARPVRYQCG
jgi:hypothetical protein